MSSVSRVGSVYEVFCTACERSFFSSCARPYPQRCEHCGTSGTLREYRDDDGVLVAVECTRGHLWCFRVRVDRPDAIVGQRIMRWRRCGQGGCRCMLRVAPPDKHLDPCSPGYMSLGQLEDALKAARGRDEARVSALQAELKTRLAPS